RRAAGEQAKVLNRLVQEDDENEGKPLKEFLGHKPIEVLAGALLGILVAVVVPM
ncbi:MAG: divergent PAP2 family protein, partial [Oscillospiraceae bacterium]|nr:divergent PAP2 family protein [Oscillospiraceae bacterium]